MKEETMRCEEVMKAGVQSLGPDDSGEASARIVRERGVGFVPICDQEGKAIGTLTGAPPGVALSDLAQHQPGTGEAKP
jgi:predicted transcriptional regulator